MAHSFHRSSNGHGTRSRGREHQRRRLSSRAQSQENGGDPEGRADARAAARQAGRLRSSSRLRHDRRARTRYPGSRTLRPARATRRWRRSWRCRRSSRVRKVTSVTRYPCTALSPSHRRRPLNTLCVDRRARSRRTCLVGVAAPCRRPGPRAPPRYRRREPVRRRRGRACARTASALPRALASAGARASALVQVSSCPLTGRGTGSSSWRRIASRCGERDASTSRTVRPVRPRRRTERSRAPRSRLVRAVHDVLLRRERESPRIVPGAASVGLVEAHHGARHGDGVGTFPDHGDDRTRGDEGDQRLEERLAEVLVVVASRRASSSIRSAFSPRRRKPRRSNRAMISPTRPRSTAVGLDHDERSFHVGLPS